MEMQEYKKFIEQYQDVGDRALEIADMLYTFDREYYDLYDPEINDIIFAEDRVTINKTEIYWSGEKRYHECQFPSAYLFMDDEEIMADAKRLKQEREEAISIKKKKEQQDSIKKERALYERLKLKFDETK